MLRGIQGSHNGLVVFEPPSRRQRLARRRSAMVAGLAGLALLSAVVGALSQTEREAPAVPAYLPYR